MPDPAAPQAPQPPAPQPARAQPLPPNLPPMEMVRLSNMFHALAHDPRTRDLIAEATNRVDPQFAGKAFQDVALEKRFKALKDEINQKELDRKIEVAVQAQQRQRKSLEEAGRSKEEIEDIEKLMNANGYHNYVHAAVIYDSQKPPVLPKFEANSATWEFPTVTNRDGSGAVPFKDFQKDSKTAAFNAAYRVIDEFKLNTLPRGFSRPS